MPYSEGFHTWTEAEIEIFRQYHKVGTKARLAMALLLYVGCRRSDVVKLGRQNLHGGSIRDRKRHV